jgi:hypothetical protein
LFTYVYQNGVGTVKAGDILEEAPAEEDLESVGEMMESTAE